jgi:aldehyde:ferredoxin oxidoreductase
MDMINGWTGKRLCIDLSLRKAWPENIPLKELHQWVGGRGLNASFFSQHFQSPVSPSSSENPIAFAVGPVAGTLAPCSGWTSIASFSPLIDSPVYGFTRMPGYFGASLKGTGFDQLILQGKADQPIYLWIDGGEVKFEEADRIWGKETTETTVAIQDEKEDRSIEVLCIGPAGERQIPFANIIHRLSWTGDYLGLGYLFGVKNLKAIAIRGKKEVTLHDPRQFLNLCLTLKDRIQKDRKMQKLKEGGKFSFLSREEEMKGINGNEGLHPGSARQWSNFLRSYLSSKEGCFACPVHCGRNVQHQDSYIGGIHLEKAWHFGPQIGVYNGEWTLKLHRFCQSQGLDPFFTSPFLARIIGGHEKGPLSEEELRQMEQIEDPGEKAFFILQQIVNGSRKGFHPVSPPISKDKDLDVLADIISFCLIVVTHLNLKTVSNMIDLIYAATGYSLSKEDLKEVVRNILQLESRLQSKESDLNEKSPFPHRGEDQTSKILRREEGNNESIVPRTTS